MAEQAKQDRVWDFATEAYLPSEDDGPATENTSILGITGVGKKTSLNPLANTDVDRSDANPDADSEPAQ